MLIAIAVGIITVATPAEAAPPVVGQGFTVTPGDLAFILKQIKIAERHSNVLQGKDTELPAIPPNPNPAADPDYCQALVGPGPDRVPDILTSYGLRTVDGSCNNLKPPLPDPTLGLPNKFAAADQPFPRLTTPIFNTAEPITQAFPVGPIGPTSYRQKTGSVVDSQPRVISNLIDDQTSANPAAVAAAKFPVRSQRNPGVVPCATVPGSNPPVDISPATPAGCVPGHQTLFIPNVTTDAGLSPPYNSLFTFFGQFFDHGVDQTVKGGGTVFVPLRADDPLIAGPDHVLGTGVASLSGVPVHGVLGWAATVTHRVTTLPVGSRRRVAFDWVARSSSVADLSAPTHYAPHLMSLPGVDVSRPAVGPEDVALAGH